MVAWQFHKKEAFKCFGLKSMRFFENLTDLFMEYAKMTGRPVANTPNVKKNGFQIFLAEILKS